MASVNIQVRGIQELSARLLNTGKRTENLRPAFIRIGRNLERFYQNDVFRSKGGAIQESWKKRRVNKPWPLLDHTGKLRRGTTSSAGRSFVRIYNDVPYFKYHQIGTQRMPQRVILKLTRQKLTEAIKEIQKEIIPALQGR